MVQSTWSGPTPLEFYAERSPSGVPEGVRHAGALALQPHALPSSSLGSEQRDCRATPRLGQCAASRAVAHGPVSGTVRETCAPSGSPGKPEARSVAVCPALREGAVASAARRQEAVRASSRYFFIELFAGSARLSQVLRSRGFRCIAIDIANGPHHDLMRRRVRRRIRRLLRSGFCLGVLAGVPCTSFSTARKFDGRGPPPLRTATHVAGRPGLSARDQEKVRLGNALLDISIDIFELCREMQIPFIWENPFTSFMWKMRRAEAVARWRHVTDVEVHYCGYGTAWKKPTRLRCFMIPAARQMLERLCRGEICRFSKSPHVRLTGTDPHGVFWTLRACAYPWPLCEKLASALIGAVRWKRFAERAGELKVNVGGVERNATSVERKSDGDDASSLASFCSLESVLSDFEATHAEPPGRVVKSSCVDESFRKHDRKQCRSTRACTLALSESLSLGTSENYDAPAADASDFNDSESSCFLSVFSCDV